MNSLIADVMAVCMMVSSLLLLFLLLHVVAVITVFMIMIMMTMTMTMAVVPMLGDNVGDESIAQVVFGKEAPGMKPTSLGCLTNMLVWQARTHMP